MTVPVKRPYAARDPAKQPSKTEPQPPPPAKRPKPPRKKPVPGRKPGRPRKTAPLGLADLPVEIVGRIAAFLLPPPVTTQDGFLPPGTMPYSGPRLKSRTAKVKTSAYGGIPSGVKDIMALALSCRHCDAGVALIIGRMGNGMSEGKKRTMYISLPNEPGANHLVPTEGTLDQSPMLQLYQHIAASSGTLETAVFHQCSHVKKNGEPGFRLGGSHLKYMQPFQRSTVHFPNLRRLQIGPNLCGHCTWALLQLFVGKTFLREKRGHLVNESDRRAHVDAERSARYPHIYELGEPARIPRYSDQARFEIDTYDHIAAPNLSLLEIFGEFSHVPDDDRSITEMLSYIPDDNTLEMVHIWLNENSRWGGFGACGSSRAHPVKDSKIAEDELTEWAKLEKDRGLSAQERLLAKFKADAAAALLTMKGKRPAQSEIGEKDRASVEALCVAAAGSLGPNKGQTGKEDFNISNGSSSVDASPIDYAPGIPPVPHRAETADEQDDEQSDEEGAKDDDPMTDLPQDNASHNDRDDSASTTTSADKKSSKSNVERHAQYSHNQLVRQYTHIIQAIARKFPNLIGLSLQRRGTSRTDITEGFKTPSELANLFVTPLQKLDKLVHLDLGLAVCGAKELADFPLGLSVYPSRKGRDKAKSFDTEIQALKRRKYEQDIKKAIEEGDAWRKEVLSEFAIPVEKEKKGEREDEGPEEVDLPPRWPSGVKSGHVISVDLHERLRGQGVAIPWKVEGHEIVLGQPKQIKL